ncbi:hypothetical protein HAX54_024288 [Datura stramonium]|uniref:Uncharacterized protein n=1 Tax=Datura stramonium TaxID=4076 RepID=A0ABS8Y6N5_DATST|nr:hypothetical protein [Datura stramonium]
MFENIVSLSTKKYSKTPKREGTQLIELSAIHLYHEKENGIKKELPGGWGKYASWLGSLKFIGNSFEFGTLKCSSTDFGSRHSQPAQRNHLVELKKMLEWLRNVCFLKWFIEVHKELV